MSILQEAFEITEQRAQGHGDAKTIAEAWACMFTAATGIPVAPRHYAVAQICQKLARDRVHSKRENWQDIAGYVSVQERAGWIPEGKAHGSVDNSDAV